MLRNNVFYSRYPSPGTNKTSRIDDPISLLEALNHAATSKAERLSLAKTYKNIIKRTSVKDCPEFGNYLNVNYYYQSADSAIEYVIYILTLLEAEDQKTYLDEMADLIKTGYQLAKILESFSEIATRYTLAVKYKNVIANNRQTADVVRTLAEDVRYEYAADFCKAPLSCECIAGVIATLKPKDRYSFFNENVRDNITTISSHDLIELISLFEPAHSIQIALTLHEVVKTTQDTTSILLHAFKSQTLSTDTFCFDPNTIYEVALLYSPEKMAAVWQLDSVMKLLKSFGVSETKLISYLDKFKENVIKNFQELKDVILLTCAYINVYKALNILEEFANKIPSVDDLLIILTSMRVADGDGSLANLLLKENFKLDQLIQDGFALSKILKIVHSNVRTNFAKRFQEKILTIEDLCVVLTTLYFDNRLQLIDNKSSLITDYKAYFAILRTWNNECYEKTTFIRQYCKLTDNAEESVENLQDLYELVHAFQGIRDILIDKIKPEIFDDFNTFHYCFVQFRENTAGRNTFLKQHLKTIETTEQIIILMNALLLHERTDFLRQCKDKVKTQESILKILETFDREDRLEPAMIFIDVLSSQESQSIGRILTNKDKIKFSEAFNKPISSALTAFSMFSESLPAEASTIHVETPEVRSSRPVPGHAP